ncbi:hypothetical protein J6590_078989 [Homalodisca vitripennis]|nr:hypothetical protein J6590_078989 [Homalodisca vitripennis]
MLKEELDSTGQGIIDEEPGGDQEIVDAADVQESLGKNRIRSAETCNKNVVQRKDLAVDEEKKFVDDSWKRVKVVNTRGNRSYEVEDGESGAPYVINERLMKSHVPEPAISNEATLDYSELILQIMNQVDSPLLAKFICQHMKMKTSDKKGPG